MWLPKVFKQKKTVKVTVVYDIEGTPTPYPGLFTPKRIEDNNVTGDHRWGSKPKEITALTLTEPKYISSSSDLSSPMEWMFDDETMRTRVIKLLPPPPLNNSESDDDNKTTETESATASAEIDEAAPPTKKVRYMTEEDFEKRLSEALAQELAKHQEAERIKASEQTTTMNANAKTGNNCLHNLTTIENRRCKSVPMTATKRKDENKLAKIEKTAATPAYLPKSKVVELINKGHSSSLPNLYHYSEGKCRVKDDPMATILGPLSVCKECSQSHYYRGGTETLCMRPSQAGNRTGTCPICRDPFNTSGRRSVVGDGGLCPHCIVPRLEKDNETFMTRLLVRPLEMATGCKVKIYKERKIDPDEDEDEDDDDSQIRTDYVLEFMKNNEIKAVIGVEVDSLSHQGEKLDSEMKKNRLFFAWAKATYSPSVRTHLIRFAPDSPQYDTSTWARYVFLRSLMILFFYKKHEYPENGSMTYMYYNPTSSLIPTDRRGVGILNGGARFDETDQSMPDWATFCDPAFLAFKSLSSKDSEQPRVVCHLSKCKTMTEIYGDGFGVKTRFGKSMR